MWPMSTSSIVSRESVDEDFITRLFTSGGGTVQNFRFFQWVVCVCVGGEVGVHNLHLHPTSSSNDWSFSLSLCRNDHRMALIQMGSTEEAVAALIVRVFGVCSPFTVNTEHQTKPPKACKLQCTTTIPSGLWWCSDIYQFNSHLVH